jgi:hypothetical protein
MVTPPVTDLPGSLVTGEDAIIVTGRTVAAKITPALTLFANIPG